MILLVSHSVTMQGQIPVHAMSLPNAVDGAEEAVSDEPTSCPANLRQEHWEQPRNEGHGELTELCNDLPAAMDVDVGKGWQILYPDASLKFEAGPVSVRLRDDHHISGRVDTKGLKCVACLLSKDFGDFASDVRSFVQKEELWVQKEEELQQRRQQELNEGELAELNKQRLSWSCIPLQCLAFVVLGFAGDVLSDESSPVFGYLFVSFYCLMTLMICMYSVFFKKERRLAKLIHDRHVEKSRTIYDILEFLLPFLACCTCFFVNTFLILLVVLLCYREDLGWAIGLSLALCCCCPIASKGLANYCGILKDPNEEEQAQQGVREVLAAACHKNIVFEGVVRSGIGRPCVCSWPGKYESAWNAMVQRSHKEDLSAAVVFLPKGSASFGCHDQIPSGDCWCSVLYGEKKPWGCRWWTAWIANIEEAMKEKAELQVFFFENMKGQGKVESFATAGAEHLHRESLWAKMKEFKESNTFLNAADGLGKLCDKAGPDSSSQYSREVQRLFFAWLPKEEGEFLAASQGLGNSQKAEVAWLEMKGYAYTEVEVKASEWVGEAAVISITKGDE